MATKRTAKTDEIEQVADAVAPEYVDFQTLDAGLSAIRAKLGIEGEADETCHVSMLDPEGKGPDAKVWIGDPENFDLQSIAKTHGSGSYRIMVYMKMPDGHKVRQINTVQAWRLSPEDESRVIAAKAAALNPPEPKAQDSNMALANVMAQGFQHLGELLIKQGQKPEIDPMAQMTALAGVIKTIMPSAPSAPANPLSGFAEVLNMVKLFNDATGAGKTTLPPDADVSTALLMKGMEMFGPVVQKAVEQKAASVPIATQPAAPALEAPKATTDEPEEYMLFKLQLKMANKSAASGSDPVDFADSIFSVLPDNVLHGMALDPNWFVFLTNAVPECKEHQAWYESVRNALIEIAVEDGVFVRDASGALTLAPDGAQNGETTSKDSPDASGTGTASPAAT